MEVEKKMEKIHKVNFVSVVWLVSQPVFKMASNDYLLVLFIPFRTAFLFTPLARTDLCDEQNIAKMTETSPERACGFDFEALFCRKPIAMF